MFTFDDPAARAEGDLLVNVVAGVRKYKHDNGLALNAPLGKVTVYSPHTANDEGDTARTLNADVHWRTDKAHLDKVVSPASTSTAPWSARHSGKMRARSWKRSRRFRRKSSAHPPKTIKVNGKDLAVPENAFVLKYSYVEEGAKVDVITVGDVIVTIATKE